MAVAGAAGVFVSVDEYRDAGIRLGKANAHFDKDMVRFDKDTVSLGRNFGSVGLDGPFWRG